MVIFVQTFKYLFVYILYTMRMRTYKLEESDMEIVHSQDYLAARIDGKEFVIYLGE